MENLKDLKELAKEVIKNFYEKFDTKDRRIPQSFKDKVKALKTFSIIYNDYSVIIKGNGVNSKDSFVPNQSFYMASYFIEYSIELSKYKQKILPLLANAGITTSDLTAFFTHERDHGKEDIAKGNDKFVKILDSIGYQDSDRSYLIKFVTDYNWWSGSKTIDRSDFFNSPVLSIMGLSASSNSAIASIVDHLTQHPEDYALLIQYREKTNVTNMNNDPLQQIFYGAPGTGKSHFIKDNEKVIEAEKKNLMFRTTFHPDSDYATFVGAYKPSMTSSERIYTTEELETKLKEIKNTGTTYPCHKFASKYWESLKDLTANEIKQILSACGFTETYGVEVSKGVAIGQEYLNKQNEGKIIYTFVPQAFTKAYTAAWNTEDEVYLIIEEINRGNCAQIFGDLFQLLDRGSDGFSEYPVYADTDLANFIKDALACSTRTDFPDGVKEGKKLVLPSNLFIWATMNTSDQSLFPIDSAFKRRWEWKYVPISDAGKAWKICVNGTEYDWWSFVKKINNKIWDATHSEDKKLGYFFCKADRKVNENDEENNVISADRFVGKVLFYVYNDVFKDYGFDDAIFKDKEDGNSDLSFQCFFKANGKPNEEKIEVFLKNLEVKLASEVEEKNDDYVSEESEEDYEEIDENDLNDNGVSDTNSPYKVTFPDGEVICEEYGWDTYIAALRKIGLDKALPFGQMFTRMNKTLPLITDKRIQDQGTYKYIKIDGYYVLSGTDSQHRLLKKMNKDLGLGLIIE